VSSLRGKRVVVVGASAGIGQAFADGAIAEGARTVLAATRLEPLAELVAATQGCEATASAIAVDFCAHADLIALFGRVSDELEGVDLLLCSLGSANMQWFGNATVQEWRATLEVNVIAVHQLVCTFLPLLNPGSIIAVISSESTSQPRSAVGVYAASKAALERSMLAWRVGYPGIRFSCAVVGATVPTDFGTTFDPEVVGLALEDWDRHGLLQENSMVTTDVAEVLANVYGGSSSIRESISIR
jgi:NAD(P)-dependent dehydrogenase (short-subunit alcohol dehydrogenase family)